MCWAEANYSSLRFKMSVRRKLSYHVVQTYVPSVLLVLITWLCFILPDSMIEARIGISMTTLLTLTAMFSSIRLDKLWQQTLLLGFHELTYLSNVLAYCCNPENNLRTWVTRWQSTFGWFSASLKFFLPFSCSLPFTGNNYAPKHKHNKSL